MLGNAASILQPQRRVDPAAAAAAAAEPGEAVPPASKRAATGLTPAATAAGQSFAEAFSAFAPPPSAPGAQPAAAAARAAAPAAAGLPPRPVGAAPMQSYAPRGAIVLVSKVGAATAAARRPFSRRVRPSLTCAPSCCTVPARQPSPAAYPAGAVAIRRSRA